MRLRSFRGLSLVFLILISGVGCADKDLNKAFDGEFPSVQNNKIINQYCQSCHIHKNFDPDIHVEGVREKYRRRYFRTAEECRSCHFIEKEWTHNQLLRRTRMPKDANRGVYREFEIKELKRRGKS